MRITTSRLFCWPFFSCNDREVSTATTQKPPAIAKANSPIDAAASHEEPVQFAYEFSVINQAHIMFCGEELSCTYTARYPTKSARSLPSRPRTGIPYIRERTARAQ